MKTDLTYLFGRMLKVSKEPEFMGFYREATRRNWSVAPSLTAFAWVMSEEEEFDAFILLKSFDNLFQAWQKLCIDYTELAPRGSEPTIDASFLSEFAERVLRPEFFNLQHPWKDFDEEQMLEVAKFFDAGFLPGRR